MRGSLAVILIMSTMVSRSFAHSWVACTDYRGDVNYFEQDKCRAWPRNYRPQPAVKGYQIASPDSQAFSGSFNSACHAPMASPWKSSYNEAFPHAVYEPGKVYCLAWPMKNHGWLPESCSEPHSKSDAGLNDDLYLYISRVNPGADPSQSEFEKRNINELAGLASNCTPGPGSNAELGECQLGLEKHQNYERDCKGFLRSPKFCDSSGMAMGTGCFKVPSDMALGHYVAQWYWRSSFIRPEGLMTVPYMSCFDFEVVARGSSEAIPGETGTTGTPDSDLPCENNVLKFTEPVLVPSPALVPTPAPLPPLCEGQAASGGECAQPGWTSEKCCPLGQQCISWQDSGYARCRSPALPTPAPVTAPAPTPSSSCKGEAEAGSECAQPDWPSEKCCPLGFQCKFWQDSGYARCLEFGTTPLPCTGQAGAGEECARPEWNSMKCCAAGLKCQFWQNSGFARCSTENQGLLQKRKKARKFLARGAALIQGRAAVVSHVARDDADKEL
eukprot:TRINITY_DN2722_c0_g1_i1.p1 TRINITY_DN2722_c0_g1~~TRINITY_DN2722_c0_g1_i1.p1  ORF type:complete len:516 (-),score=63.53 TRINITY_DN2722_c0_g1_i1:314-1813(-)